MFQKKTSIDMMLQEEALRALQSVMGDMQLWCTWLYLGSSRLARLISKCSLKIDFVLGVVYFWWSIPFMTCWNGSSVYSSRDAFSSGLGSKGLRMGRRNFRESLDPLTNMAWGWRSLRLRIFHRTPVLSEKRLALFIEVLKQMSFQCKTTG